MHSNLTQCSFLAGFNTIFFDRLLFGRGLLFSTTQVNTQIRLFGRAIRKSLLHIRIFWCESNSVDITGEGGSSSDNGDMEFLWDWTKFGPNKILSPGLKP